MQFRKTTGMLWHKIVTW